MKTDRNEKIEHQVIGIGGSPRRKGNSDILLECITTRINQSGFMTKRILLRDYRFGSCIGCEKCRTDKICTGLNDGMTLLYPYVLESKGLVVVSPTHNYNVSALIKAFIDRLYCFYEFSDTRPRNWQSRLADQGRKAVIAAICEQESRENMGVTLDAMRMPLKALGYEIVDEIAVFNLFDRGIIKENPDILERIEQAGAALCQALRHS